MNAIRNRLTYANVVASIALFAALGGSSYAAITVSGKNIQDSSVTTKDVRNRSLVAKDFKAGQLPAGPQGAQGPQGLPGAKGDTGPQGIQGVPGVSGVEFVEAESLETSASPKSAAAQCPSGKKLIGMGADIVGGKDGSAPVMETHVVIDEVASFDDTTARAQAFETEPFGESWKVEAIAICANVS